MDAQRMLGRRRRANVAGGRTLEHRVKLTEEEGAQLRAMAELRGVTVPRLLVECALRPGGQVGGDSDDRRREDITELFGAFRLLSKISINVNQLARAANSTGEVPPETAAVLDAVRRTAERIKAQTQELGSRW